MLTRAGVKAGRPHRPPGGRIVGPAVVAAAGRPQLAPRAKAILRCARRLLESDPQRFGLPRGWRCPDTLGIWAELLAAAAGLSAPARAHLRTLAMWVAEYEAYEAAAAGGAA